MTKAELIASVAKEARISKAAAAQAIDSITASITLCGKPQGQDR